MMIGTQGLSRRGFLAATGRLFLGAGAAAGGFAEAAEAKGMLVGVRDAHLHVVGGKDAWSALRAIGAQSVEVVVLPDFSCPNLRRSDGGKYSIADDGAARKLADDARSNGVRIAAFCMANRFDERPDEEVKWVSRVAAASKIVGAGAIRIDVVPRRIKNEDEFLRFAIGMGKKLVSATAESGVRFGVENHGGTTNRVEFLERFFDGVGSERMGLTLDTANFYWFGYPLDDLYKTYEKFASRVCHTHCKSIAYPADKRNVRRPRGWKYGKYNCPIYEGDIDFKRVVAILRAAGYRNDLCVENESLGKFPRAKQGEVLAREIAFLKKLV